MRTSISAVNRILQQANARQPVSKIRLSPAMFDSQQAYRLSNQHYWRDILTDGGSGQNSGFLAGTHDADGRPYVNNSDVFSSYDLGNGSVVIAGAKNDRVSLGESGRLLVLGPLNRGGAECRVTVSSGQAGVIVLADSDSDPSNYVTAYVTAGGEFVVSKVLSGSSTQLYTSGVSVSDVRVGLYCLLAGESVEVDILLNGTIVATVQLVEEVFRATRNYYYGFVSTSPLNELSYGFLSGLTPKMSVSPVYIKPIGTPGAGNPSCSVAIVGSNAWMWCPVVAYVSGLTQGRAGLLLVGIGVLTIVVERTSDGSFIRSYDGNGNLVHSFDITYVDGAPLMVYTATQGPYTVTEVYYNHQYVGQTWGWASLSYSLYSETPDVVFPCHFMISGQAYSPYFSLDKRCSLRVKKFSNVGQPGMENTWSGGLELLNGQYAHVDSIRLSKEGDNIVLYAICREHSGGGALSLAVPARLSAGRSGRIYVYEKMNPYSQASSGGDPRVPPYPIAPHLSTYSSLLCVDKELNVHAIHGLASEYAFTYAKPNTYPLVVGGEVSQPQYGYRVYSVCEHNGRLYVTGSFSRAGSYSVTGFACYDLSSGQWLPTPTLGISEPRWLFAPNDRDADGVVYRFDEPYYSRDWEAFYRSNYPVGSWGAQSTFRDIKLSDRADFLGRLYLYGCGFEAFGLKDLAVFDTQNHRFIDPRLVHSDLANWAYILAVGLSPNGEYLGIWGFRKGSPNYNNTSIYIYSLRSGAITYSASSGPSGIFGISISYARTTLQASLHILDDGTPRFLTLGTRGGTLTRLHNFIYRFVNNAWVQVYATSPNASAYWYGAVDANVGGSAFFRGVDAIVTSLLFTFVKLDGSAHYSSTRRHNNVCVQGEDVYVTIADGHNVARVNTNEGITRSVWVKLPLKVANRYLLKFVLNGDGTSMVGMVRYELSGSYDIYLLDYKGMYSSTGGGILPIVCKVGPGKCEVGFITIQGAVASIAFMGNVLSGLYIDGSTRPPVELVSYTDERNFSLLACAKQGAKYYLYRVDVSNGVPTSSSLLNTNLNSVYSMDIGRKFIIIGGYGDPYVDGEGRTNAFVTQVYDRRNISSVSVYNSLSGGERAAANTPGLWMIESGDTVISFGGGSRSATYWPPGSASRYGPWYISVAYSVDLLELSNRVVKWTLSHSGANSACILSVTLDNNDGVLNQNNLIKVLANLELYAGFIDEDNVAHYDKIGDFFVNRISHEIEYGRQVIELECSDYLFLLNESQYASQSQPFLHFMSQVITDVPMYKYTFNPSTGSGSYSANDPFKSGDAAALIGQPAYIADNSNPGNSYIALRNTNDAGSGSDPSNPAKQPMLYVWSAGATKDDFDCYFTLFFETSDTCGAAGPIVIGNTKNIMDGSLAVLIRPSGGSCEARLCVMQNRQTNVAPVGQRDTYFYETVSSVEISGAVGDGRNRWLPFRVRKRGNTIYLFYRGSGQDVVVATWSCDWFAPQWYIDNRRRGQIAFFAAPFRTSSSSGRAVYMKDIFMYSLESNKTVEHIVGRLVQYVYSGTGVDVLFERSFYDSFHNGQHNGKYAYISNCSIVQSPYSVSGYVMEMGANSVIAPRIYNYNEYIDIKFSVNAYGRTVIARCRSVEGRGKGFDVYITNTSSQSTSVALYRYENNSYSHVRTVVVRDIVIVPNTIYKLTISSVGDYVSIFINDVCLFTFKYLLLSYKYVPGSQDTIAYMLLSSTGGVRVAEITVPALNMVITGLDGSIGFVVNPADKISDAVNRAMEQNAGKYFMRGKTLVCGRLMPPRDKVDVFSDEPPYDLSDTMTKFSKSFDSSGWYTAVQVIGADGAFGPLVASNVENEYNYYRVYYHFAEGVTDTSLLYDIGRAQLLEKSENRNQESLSCYPILQAEVRDRVNLTVHVNPEQQSSPVMYSLSRLINSYTLSFERNDNSVDLSMEIELVGAESV